MTVCRFATIFVLLCFAFGITPRAWADPILVTSNDVLEIRFRLPQAPPADRDLLYVNFVNLDILSPIGTHSASLFDGNPRRQAEVDQQCSLEVALSGNGIGNSR
jgi:hypothetical protein